MVNFPTHIPDCYTHSPALLDLFLSFDARIYCIVAFAPLGNFDHVVPISIDVSTNSQQSALFHCTDYDYSHADWESLHIHARISLNSVLLLLVMNLVGGFRLELIYIYIPHCMYHIKPHSYPWFSAACATVIVQRNYFFC